MTFTKSGLDLTPIVDTVFSVADLAKKDIEAHGPAGVYNATLGSLCDEEGNLVALPSVFDHLNAMDNRIKAAYAQSFVGNASYRKAVADWVLGDKIDPSHVKVLATPGGTGAVDLVLHNTLEEGDTVLLPDLAWGSYALMASMAQLKVASYTLFDGEQFNLASFKEQCEKIIAAQEKLVVVINDPCHNPSGYSMTRAEWDAVIDILNVCSQEKPVILLDDIAYIDYAYSRDHARDYMTCFNQCSPTVMTIVAFSCSKSLTSYGLRCGAALLISSSPQALQETYTVFEKFARATWSNINNGAMENFTWVVTQNKDAYMKEKEVYVDLLAKRSQAFLHELQTNNIPFYPYKEGFFITLQCPNNQARDELHKKLMEAHIYAVCVNKGIRIAICSLPLSKIQGIGEKIASLLK